MAKSPYLSRRVLLENTPRALDRGRVELSGRERVDDVAMLGDEVRVTLDVATADHLHHQVHGELPVEAREERIARDVDLVLVERCVGGIPLLVRDRSVRSLEELGEAGQLRRVEAAARRRGARVRAARRSPRPLPAPSPARRSSRVVVVR